MGVRQVTEREGRQYGAILAERLKERKLPCENGPARLVDASEFMIMHRNDSGREVGCKHRDTRNYVYLRVRFDRDLNKEVWVLDVPSTLEPFHLGWFDAI